MVPLRSDTIQLVQNGCSFHGLRSEDPNQRLKDFLKLVDSLDLDESLSEAWTRFKDLLHKVPHHGINLWLQENEAEEESSVEPSKTNYTNDENANDADEEVESKKEVEEETNGEIEEEEEDNPKHFDTFPTMKELSLDLGPEYKYDEYVCRGIRSFMAAKARRKSRGEVIDSLLLTPLCCDDIHDVTPRVSALAGCDRLVSEPLVIENDVSLIRKKFCWGTIFPIGLKRYRDPKEEPIEKEPLMELKEICSLIPLSRGSFDVIVGMDWLSKRKFVIVCHEKVVRIPLEGDEILRVHGERTQGVVKTLMNTKFRIDLVHGATPVVKSPYRLAPSEMQELSEQLRELQDTANVVSDALSRKERVKSSRVRGMILAAQSEAFKQENVFAERLHGSVMDEAYASRYLVHPGADKTYYKLGDMYW
ncbi:hypothetical protein Tco_0624565 [Tanacetum coccineum]|uniref:Reverse transcriptase domain-containing protein n=1 Tax=Tanacetum coccineum TaxID=301880 RepID=A0ABQ4WEE1_9ASTR